MTVNPDPEAPATRIRIVLVQTQHPGNIGSAARAMPHLEIARTLIAGEKVRRARSLPPRRWAGGFARSPLVFAGARARAQLILQRGIQFAEKWAATAQADGANHESAGVPPPPPPGSEGQAA